MKKQIVKFKIDHVVRKQISELAVKLPPVPFFIEVNGEMVPQRITQGKRISGHELKESGGKVEGGADIDVKATYIQKGKQTRMMNHKVTLTEQYELKGQPGIDLYVGYVHQMHAMLNKKNPAKAVATTPTGMMMPKREDFGFKEVDHIQDGITGMQGEWTVEGGEQAFNKAMAEFEEHVANMNNLKPNAVMEETGPFPEMPQSEEPIHPQDVQL